MMFVSVYRDDRGDSVGHAINNVRPHWIGTNDPDDDSRTPGYLVETLCGRQEETDVLFTDWPGEESCAECRSAVMLGEGNNR